MKSRENLSGEFIQSGPRLIVNAFRDESWSRSKDSVCEIKEIRDSSGDGSRIEDDELSRTDRSILMEAVWQKSDVIG